MLRKPSSNKIDMTEINNMVSNEFDKQLLLIPIDIVPDISDPTPQIYPRFILPGGNIKASFGSNVTADYYMKLGEIRVPGVIPLSYLDDYDILTTIAPDVGNAIMEYCFCVYEEANEHLKGTPCISCYSSMIWYSTDGIFDSMNGAPLLWKLPKATVVLKKKKKNIIIQYFTHILSIYYFSIIKRRRILYA